MTLATPEQNKAIYTGLHDRIIEKRFRSASLVRRHAHLRQYQVFSDLVPAGATVLDAGCGEGVLSVLLAQKGCIVTGIDLSEPNIRSARAHAASEGVADRVTFRTGDIESMGMADKSFDYVVSSHVLEHVPDFVRGARELRRLTRQRAIIAIPTCLNPCAMVLLGKDKYWMISRRTPYALLWGFLQVLGAWLTGEDGVNEGYEGRPELIHIWRFPWRGRKSIEAGGLRVDSYCASSYPFPYLSFLVPLSTFLERFAWLPVLRNFGYGTTYVCRPE